MYGQPARVTSQAPNQPPRSPTCWDPREVPSVTEHSCRSPLREIPLSTAVSDYNENLRIYRLEQAALLARLNCVFEENIDEENLVEDVPNNAAHYRGANLDVDVPINESLEEIVKTDNMPLQVLVEVYDEKFGDLIPPTHQELEMREDTESLLKKENKAEALRSSLEPKEQNFSVLTERPSEKESMEKRRLFEEELKLKAEELGKTWDAHSGSHALACVYVDLNVGDVPSLTLQSTSLDTDARLIPPRNDTPCLSILRGVDKLFVLAWNFADNIGSPLLISDRGDKGRRSAVRCVFDPGGDASPKLLLSTSVVPS